MRAETCRRFERAVPPWPRKQERGEGGAPGNQGNRLGAVTAAECILVALSESPLNPALTFQRLRACVELPG
jgi:hypothetical protein